jgi:hypothetical protein
MCTACFVSTSAVGEAQPYERLRALSQHMPNKSQRAILQTDVRLDKTDMKQEKGLE